MHTLSSHGLGAKRCIYTSSTHRRAAKRCIYTLLAVVVAGCGGMQRSGKGHPLAAGEVAENPATGLAVEQATGRGALAYAAAFSGDGQILASAELFGQFRLVIRTAQGARATNEIALGPATYDITDLALSAGGELLWVASRAGTVRSFHRSSGKLATIWHLGSPVTALAISPDGVYAAMGTATGVVCLRRIRDAALLQCMVAHRGQISGLDFSASGSRLASAATAGEIAVWSVPSLAKVAAKTLGGAVNDIAFSPDQARLAIARSPEPAKLTPERARHLQGDGERLRGRVEVWPATLDGHGVVRLPGHRPAATTVAWLGNRRLLSGGWDGAVRLWDAAAKPRHALATLTGIGTLIHDIAVSPDHRRLAIATWIATIDQPAMVVAQILYP